MVALGGLVEVRDMDFPDLAVLGLVIRNHVEFPVVSLCLVSELNFKGNGRIRIGKYFVYPSIQSVAWTVQCLVEKPVFLKANQATSLLAWPALDLPERIGMVEAWGLTYSPAEHVENNKGFQTEVVKLANSSEDFFGCLQDGEFLDGEAVNHWAKAAPSELVLEEHGRIDLALATRDGLGERGALYRSITHGANSDALRLLLRKETGVLSVNRFSSGSVDEFDYALAAKNGGIKSFILRKHASQGSHKVQEIVVDGVTVRVHSLRSRKQASR